MTLSWKALVGGAAAVALLAASTALGSHAASAQPTPPTRFFGTVTLGGQPAPSGATVQARVGTNVCGTATVTTSGGTSNYVVDVASASTQPGCGTDGATVTFTVNGAPASQTGTFQTGAFVTLNLTAQAATPTPTATPTVVRTATPPPPPPPPPTVVRTATPPPPPPPTVVRTPTVVATAQRAAGTPAAQRAAAPPAAAAPALPRTGAGTGADGLSGSALALLGIALAAALLGAGSLAVSRRSR